MKILYIHQYFSTPDEPGGTRSYWFAKELINKGFEVTLITSTNKYEHKHPGRQKIEGINVIYVKNDYSNYFSKFQKIKSFVKFMIKSTIVASKEKNVDLVFATSTPLTVGIIALWLYYFRRWKYVFEVRDLWPEFPIQIGAINNKLLIRVLRWLEKIIYKKAEFIIALSPGMEEGVLNAGISKDKVCVIPNMAKPDIFYPRPVNEEIVKSHAIDLNKLNIIHFGSMGVANGLTTLIESARILQDWGKENIEFIFLGDGATKPMLMDKVKADNLKNVKFLGNYGMQLTSEIVNSCDISVVSFKNLPILSTNSPNKLFDSLSAGKPIIVNSAGWTKKLVEDNNCGFYVHPDFPEQLADQLVKCAEDPDQLNQWGSNSRKLSLEVFDKSILSGKFVEVIIQVLNNFK